MKIKCLVCGNEWDSNKFEECPYCEEDDDTDFANITGIMYAGVLGLLFND